jgi:ubiquinone/menaquinone biosynthesis C-methylase UbiE
MRKRLGFSRLVVVAVTLLATTARAQAQTAPTTSFQQEEAAREAWQKLPELFHAMAVRPGAVVADVGAGGGFLTVRLARVVGQEGRVIAVEVNARTLDRLRDRVLRESLMNVEFIKGDEDNPHLPPSSIDAAVIVNAYHEMRDYHAMLHHLRIALKPDGRLVIVEPLSEKRRNGSREEQIRDHEIAPGFVEQEAREAGFRIMRLEDPFTTRNTGAMWLLVATPDLLAPDHSAVCPLLRPKSPASPIPPPEADDNASAISNPDLRIMFERFKKLLEEDAIVVVDVRTEEEYQSGHIAGAIWIPIQKVGEHAAQLRESGKPIVTYCG